MRSSNIGQQNLYFKIASYITLIMRSSNISVWKKNLFFASFVILIHYSNPNPNPNLHHFFLQKTI